MIPSWVNDYIGIPFSDHGRDRSGCDCYGLVCLVFRDQFNLSLPGHEDSYHTVSDREMIAQQIHEQKIDWRKIYGQQHAQLGDVVVFRVAGLPVHCGIMVDPVYMLHVVKGCNAVLEPAFGMVWGNRLEGIYRHA